ncbi:alcohol acetyltransferase [Pseudoneurospora amorphoporcata]|uniref:Alcohol acetyltransferase n=1 Tax=Pseudoneurospora amorphoporcata TaxID=241081 RepID=A0AAN6P2H6_9PEZI|nr:alcohol acetyltransferase [Pseudoneurospora amorphoporcata]
MTNVPQPIRPLGPCEIYSSSRHALGFYRCLANTCRYAVPWSVLQGKSVPDVLEAAVANLVLRLPRLSLAITGDEASRPCFASVPSLDLSYHLECVELPAELDSHARDSHLLHILEAQHNQLWPDVATRPPWRLLAVYEPRPSHYQDRLILDIVLAIHHSLADGRSTAIFHASLLDELNKPPARPSCLEDHVLRMPSKPHGHILPPQEELVKFTTSWRFLAGTLWSEFASGWLRKPATDLPWTGAPVRPDPYQTRLRLVTIPAKAVSQLLANCRANGTTLTPLLHVLILTSLARRLPAETATSFQSCTPIDLRPFIQSGSHVTDLADAFGVLVTSASHSFDSSRLSGLREQASGENIWCLAQTLRQELKERVETIPQDDMVNMLSWITNWRGFWLNKVDKPREQTWEVSNIHSLRGSPEGTANETGANWEILRSVMSQCAIVAGPALCASVSGVIGGPISIALSWQQGIIESEVVEGVAYDLQLWMDQGGPVHGQKLP